MAILTLVWVAMMAGCCSGQLVQYSFNFYDGPNERSETLDATGLVHGTFNYLDDNGNVKTQYYDYFPEIVRPVKAPRPALKPLETAHTPETNEAGVDDEDGVELKQEAPVDSVAKINEAPLLEAEHDTKTNETNIDNEQYSETTTDHDFKVTPDVEDAPKSTDVSRQNPRADVSSQNPRADVSRQNSRADVSRQNHRTFISRHNPRTIFSLQNPRTIVSRQNIRVGVSRQNPRAKRSLFSPYYSPLRFSYGYSTPLPYSHPTFNLQNLPYVPTATTFTTYGASVAPLNTNILQVVENPGLATTYRVY